MRKYQIWKAINSYAISDFENDMIDFATQKDFSTGFKIEDVIETDSASKPAFVEYLKPVITDHGIHPIYNSKGEIREQIVNIPNRILSSDEILDYLNKYTILPQETPPWEEIIYKLRCYSEKLTNEFYDQQSSSFGGDIDKLVEYIRTEEDTDVHHFVTAPKLSENKRGHVFSLPKPNRAHRKWIILDKFYDWSKNAWINLESGEISKRKKSKVALIDKVKIITDKEIAYAKKTFLDNGGKITNLDISKKPATNPDGWKELEIHPFAYLIPVMKPDDRERLKEDIRLNGVLVPIKLFEGKVLDGRTRQGICLELGMKPPYDQWRGTGSPREYVISVNLKRRHLTQSQFAAIGVQELLPEFEKEAEKRRLSAIKNKNKKHVSAILRYKEQGKASLMVATYLKTSPKYVEDAKFIKENSPDLFQKVLAGELTISKAKTSLNSSTKKKRISRKFEKHYKILLDLLTERSTPNFLPNSEIAFKRISDIYLKWNRKNNKKMIAMLDNLKSDFPEIFEERKERHLRLLQM